MIIFLLILFGLYLVFMLALAIGFRRVPVFREEIQTPTTQFSIVIPFRNEAENLPFLLESISKLDYPPNLYEVLFVNDDSDDVSAEVIQHFIQRSEISIQIVQNKRLSNSPKKDAITEAINHSKSDWIVTTDADCELPTKWLKTLDAFLQTASRSGEKPVMVCGLVIYKSDHSFIECFQQIDGFSLQTVAMGSFGLKNPILSNGANLAYKKSAFKTVNGFDGNNHVASGDDIFLMEKIKQTFPQKVQFLKSRDAAVSTTPQQSWKEVINQRIRWVSKTSKQKNSSSILLGLLVFLANIFFIALPILMAFDFKNLIVYLLILFFKILIDYVVIRQSAIFFNESVLFLKFLWLPFLYSFLMVIIVFGGLTGGYSWKGRYFYT